MKRAIGGYLLLAAVAGALATLYEAGSGGVDPWELPAVAAERPMLPLNAASLPSDELLPTDGEPRWSAEAATESVAPPPAAPPDSSAPVLDEPPSPAPRIDDSPPPAPSVNEPPAPSPMADEPPPPTPLVEDPTSPPPPAPLAPAPLSTAESQMEPESAVAEESWDGVLPMVSSMSGSCDLCGACSCNLAKHVIWTPMDITEIRMESHTVTETKDQEQTYTVFRRVPVTREIKKKECYLVDEVRTKVITEKQCYRVTNPVVTTYTAMVPVTEVREETCKKTICTEDGPACVEVPVTRVVTVEHPQECSEVSEQSGVAFGTTTCEISYVVKVPKTREVVCSKQTVYELVPVEQKRTVQVCVPKVIELPNEVTVCKMIPHAVYCCEACAKKHGADRACLSERRREQDKEGPFAKLHEAWTDHLEKHEGPLAKLQAHRHRDQ